MQIPVELYPGDEQRELSFTMLDKRDLSPVGYQRVNKKTGQQVPYDLIVKGYEHAKGEYVVLSPSDFLKANVEATQTIDIQDFVPSKDISSTHFDRPYFVKPKKQGAKAYEVLRSALQHSGRAGIATLVLHTRQHLAALVAEGDVLLLDLLRFADEVRSGSETVGALPQATKVTSQEQAMAEQLIDGMSGAWTPTKYHDTYREDLLKIIENKVAAGQVNVVGDQEAPPAPRAASEGAIDLVALLRRSIDAHQEKGGDGKKAGVTSTAEKAHRRIKPAPARARHTRRTA